MSHLCVVGLGRVGLPTAALAASAGHRVLGVDRDADARDHARSGRTDEPGLAALLAAHPFPVVESPRPADAYVLCVGRPADQGRDGPADADLRAALAAVAEVAPPGSLCVIEATVPVGTTDALADAFPGLRLACAPERVLPGRALDEIRGNPRVVGGPPPIAEAAVALLSTWCRGPIAAVDRRTAELCKLVENTARDVQIALANTVATLARHHGVDPVALRSLVNQHPRVALLQPGIGVGGPCLPVDPWLLVEGAPEEPLVLAARAVNDAVPARAAARVAREEGAVGLLGLTYKPDCADLRHAPALRVARLLAAERSVLAHDPHLTGPVDGVDLGSFEEVLSRDVVVLLVAHGAFAGWRARVRPDARALDLTGGWR